MTGAADDTPPQQRLAAGLRQLRLAANLSGEELARRTGFSQSKVSRIETMRQVPSVNEVRLWAQVTSASADAAGELAALAEALATEATSWRLLHRQGLRRKQEEVGTLEQAATAIRMFQPVMVPGLLQTAEYARRVMEQGNPSAQADMAAAVTARLERQAILYDQAKHFEFVITEAALRWRPGPVPVQLAQLDRVASMSTLSNVQVGIVRLDILAADAYLHPFAIFEGDDELVTVETYTAELRVRDAPDVAFYQQTLGRLRGTAVYGDEARHLIERIASAVRATR